MAPRATGILGLDLRDDALCVASYDAANQTVTSVAIQPLDEAVSDDPRRAEHTLKHVIGETSLGGRSAVISLPAEHAIIKKVELDADEDDIRGAIEWELGQQILSPMEEYVFDYEEIDAAASNTQRFLAVAYRTAAVQRICQIARAGKLSPAVVDLDVFALIDLFEMNYSEEIGKPAILVLGNDTSLKMVLTHNGRFVDFEMLDSRSFAEDTASCVQSIQKGVAVLQEANPEFSQNQQLPIYLSGPLFSSEEIATNVRRSVRNAAILFPFRKIACGANITEDNLKLVAPQLTVAVGLAVRGSLEQ